MHNVIVDLVSDFLSKMRGAGRNAFTRERANILDAEKDRAHGSGEYRAFHVLFLPFPSINLDRFRAARIRVDSTKTLHCVALDIR